MTECNSSRPWADPHSSGNEIRPKVRCVGCGHLGCVTYWGPWCFSCNVKRLDRIDQAMADIEEYLGGNTE